VTFPPNKVCYRVARGVAVECGEGADTRVFVAQLPDGPLVCLDGTAAIIWTQALTNGETSVTDRVAKAVGLAVREVEQDVQKFIDELIRQGLIVQINEAGLP
jgi:hypothetical protein